MPVGQSEANELFNFMQRLQKSVRDAQSRAAQTGDPSELQRLLPMVDRTAALAAHARLGEGGGAGTPVEAKGGFFQPKQTFPPHPDREDRVRGLPQIPTEDVPFGSQGTSGEELSRITQIPKGSPDVPTPGIKTPFMDILPNSVMQSPDTKRLLEMVSEARRVPVTRTGFVEDVGTQARQLLEGAKIFIPTTDIEQTKQRVEQRIQGLPAPKQETGALVRRQAELSGAEVDQARKDAAASPAPTEVGLPQPSPLEEGGLPPPDDMISPDRINASLAKFLPGAPPQEQSAAKQALDVFNQRVKEELGDEPRKLFTGTFLNILTDLISVLALGAPTVLKQFQSEQAQFRAGKQKIGSEVFRSQFGLLPGQRGSSRGGAPSIRDMATLSKMIQDRGKVEGFQILSRLRTLDARRQSPLTSKEEMAAIQQDEDKLATKLAELGIETSEHIDQLIRRSIGMVEGQ